MLETGELDQIITDTVLSEMNIFHLKLDDYINVKLYGAIGDHNSHKLKDKYPTLESAKQVYPTATSMEDEIDGLAIQKAIVENPDKTIFIPDGSYIINTPIRLNERQKITGIGMNDTVLNYTLDDGSLIDISGLAHIDIENMSLLHSFVIEEVGSTNTAKAINARKVPYGRYKNLTIKGFDYGIDFGELSYCSEIDNMIVQACNYGFNANGEFNAISVSRYNATYCDIGAYVGGGRTVTLNDCLFEVNNLGIRKVNMGDLNVKACYFERNHQDIATNYGANAPYKVTISDSSFFRNEDNIDDDSAIYLHGDAKTMIIIKNCEFTKYNLDEYSILTGYNGTPVKIILEDNYIDDGVSKVKQGFSFANIVDRDSFTLNKASASYNHSHTPNFVIQNSENKIYLDGIYDSYRAYVGENTEIFLPEKNVNGNSYEFFITIENGKSVQIKVNPNSTDTIGNAPLYTNNTGAKQYLVGKVFMVVSRTTGIEYGLVWYNV